MLVYNPPKTQHRDRFATTGGRFLSIDLPPGSEPATIANAVVLDRGEARSAAMRVAAVMLSGASDLALQDAFLGVSASLEGAGDENRTLPSWLRVAVEALADLANEAELRVHDLAQLTGVHPVHLARVFRRHLGCSPGEVIRRTRVERAAAALSTGHSLAGLAAEHGFSDHAHLTRCFRAAYGVPPAAFRAAFD
ncbi:helix-turn-helix transcriptional regulator [Sphingomonas sp. HF-S4]|uniref:Helix-turn-helix transcriptional regulator n=1 Tax=Sphingomonas agrestis TaxID=3080540 RepID=A0ABU3Y609_9SPHN|nr:helix-turn-helix transcriptional regulator [Sphingomonas sp. HF-S4]MDV3456831.1 helix-turn-helix transcriptional regulator [Sphingomonas sp. HF-S4]